MSALPLSPQDRYNSLRSLFETTNQTASPDLLKKYHSWATELYKEVAKMECLPSASDFEELGDLKLLFDKIYLLATQIDTRIQTLYKNRFKSP